MLCSKCLKDIPKNRKVKLKDSIVCNKCAERIQKEYHKERYKKYLRGEINYEELDPEGGRPIDKEFLEVVCWHCFKSLAKDSEEVYGKSSSIAYDKCQGKKCPDCGKVRCLGHIELEVFKDGFAGFMRVCPRCQKETGSKFNGVCWNCFCEREEERGCFCILNKHSLSKSYYCFLCEDVHVLEFWCSECTKLIKEGTVVPLGKKLVRPWKIIVPSVLSGILLGTIITFLITKKVFTKKSKQKQFFFKSK